MLEFDLLHSPNFIAFPIPIITYCLPKYHLSNRFYIVDYRFLRTIRFEIKDHQLFYHLKNIDLSQFITP